MITLASKTWTGSTPGYVDAIPGGCAISLPDRQQIVTLNGTVLALPEYANNVWLSDGGQLAWQGHSSGLIYNGLTSTGQQGYGQWSALWVGETLKLFTDVATFKATGGGWRYVSDAGALVSYGATYSGPPLWEYTTRGDVTIGQGPNDGDGICCVLPDGIVRQILAGDWHNIRVRRSGDLVVIGAVNYAAHLTSVWTVTRAELATMPALTHAPSVPPPAPIPVPVQEPQPMEFPNHLDIVQRERAKYGPSLDDITCFAVTNAVAADPAVRADGWGLTKAPAGGSGVVIAGQNYRTDKLCHPAGYINDILGSTPGPASPQWGPNADANGNPSNWAPAVSLTPVQPPSNPPPPPPPPSVDLSGIEAEIVELRAVADGLRADLDALKAGQALPDLSAFAKKGDAVTVNVSGKVSIFGLNKWGGTGTINE